MKKRFSNLIIIDASGSMASKAEEVRGGLKELFKQIKGNTKKNPEIVTTTIVCDFSSAGDFNVIVNSNDPKDLKGSIAARYIPRAMTALYDAIGKGFNLVPKKQDGVYVNILTDGLENDSKEFKADDIKSLISKAKKKKWGITFMGTTEEATLIAQRDLGVSLGNTAVFADSKRGVKTASKMRMTSNTSYYMSVLNETLSDDNVDELMKEAEESED